jgi:hypothetical protein
MYIKCEGLVWANLSLLNGMNVVQNGSDWEVRSELTSSGQLIRTLGSEGAAQDFVEQVAAEIGLSPL